MIPWIFVCATIEIKESTISYSARGFPLKNVTYIRLRQVQTGAGHITFETYTE